MITLIAVILVFGVIVFVHEFGHFIAAKAFGMRVDEFAIGMGPALWSKQKGETQYSIRSIPLGGYNKIAGMSQEEDLDDRSFLSKPRYQQFIVILAGPVFNLLLAIGLVFMVFVSQGVQHPSNEPVIGSVEPGSPAAMTHLQPQDRIISIQGKPIKLFSDIPEAIAPLSHSAFDVTIERNGAKQTIPMTAMITDSGRAIIGIAPEMKHTYFTIPEAATHSVTYTVGFTKSMVQGLIAMVTGKEKAEVAGPIGIVRIVNSAASVSIWSVIMLTAILSINLGVINLFPIPVLDGGRLVLIIIESIIRRNLPSKALMYIQSVGLVIIVLLMAYATFSDIMRI